MVQPLVMLAFLVAAFVVWPPLAPYVVWLPMLGPALGGLIVVQALSRGPAGVLTRRLEHVALLRAAGAASGLAPDTAVVAFGADAVAIAAVHAVATVMQRVHDARAGCSDGPPEPTRESEAVRSGVSLDRTSVLVRRPDSSGRHGASESEATLLREYILALLSRAERKALLKNKFKAAVSAVGKTAVVPKSSAMRTADHADRNFMLV